MSVESVELVADDGFDLLFSYVVQAFPYVVQTFPYVVGHCFYVAQAFQFFCLVLPDFEEILDSGFRVNDQSKLDNDLNWSLVAPAHLKDSLN